MKPRKSSWRKTYAGIDGCRFISEMNVLEAFFVCVLASQFET